MSRARSGLGAAFPGRAWASLSATSIKMAGQISSWLTIHFRSSFFITIANGTFSEVALNMGLGYNDDGETFAGMGADFADYDNDGWPDIFVNSLANQRYALFHNDKGKTFSYVSQPSGVASNYIAAFRLGRALLRLRQRRLEGSFRRAGACDGQHRAHAAVDSLSGAVAAAAK